MVMETAKAAKDFIEAELGKYGTWEEFRSSANRGPIFNVADTEPSFRSLKGQGVGITAIHAFLGWKSKSKIEDTRARGTSALMKKRCFSDMLGDMNLNKETVSPVDVGVSLRALVEKCATDLITAMDTAGRAES